MLHLLAIVTGTSRGLGRAIATRMLARDARVLGIARRRSAALESSAVQRGAALEQWALDLADPVPAARRLERWLAEQSVHAPVRTVLVNNAGVLVPPGPFEDADDEQVITALRASLESAVLLTGAFLRATRDWAGERCVLTVSSSLGRRPQAGCAVYCSAKAGLDHFCRTVALEQARRVHGARIVALAPGAVDTDMQALLREADPRTFPDQAHYAKLHRDGRLPSADAAAERVLAYLDRSDFGANPVADVRDARA